MQVLLLRFDDEEFACTGKQIAAVLEFLVAIPEFEQCTWYAGGLDAFAPRLAPYDTERAVRIEDVPQFIERVRDTTQFLDGVFLATCDPSRPETVGDRMSAEEPWEMLVETSAVEIRAFDTTYVAVFSRDASVIDRVSRQFGGTLETLP